MKVIFSALLATLFLHGSCHMDETVNPAVYDCNITYTDSSDWHPKAAAFQGFINERISQGFPGMILLVKDSMGLWTGTGGMADLYTAIEMKKCHISRVASITKNFTCVAIFQLQEQGKLHLDDRAAQYLDDEIVNDIDNLDKCTIRQLIEHTSGIYDYDSNISYNLEGINNPDQVWSKEKALSYVFGKQALFEPGSSYSYCNTGYILLGMIVESLESKPVQDVMEQEIFQPAGMDHTVFPLNYSHPDGLIPGYDNRHGDGKLINTEKYAFGYYTDGGIVTDVYDLYRYMRALYKDSTLLSSMSVQQLISPSGYVSTEPNANIIANGPVLWQTPYGLAYTNSGGQYGYRAFMLYYPDTDYYAVMLFNSSLIEDDELFYQSQSDLIDLLYN